MLRCTTSLVYYGVLNTLPFAAKIIKTDFSEPGEGGGIIDKIHKSKENMGVSVRIEPESWTSHINVRFPPPFFVFTNLDFLFHTG